MYYIIYIIVEFCSLKYRGIPVGRSVICGMLRRVVLLWTKPVFPRRRLSWGYRRQGSIHMWLLSIVHWCTMWTRQLHFHPEWRPLSVWHDQTDLLLHARTGTRLRNTLTYAHDPSVSWNKLKAR